MPLANHRGIGMNLFRQTNHPLITTTLAENTHSAGSSAAIAKPLIPRNTRR